MSHPRSSGVLLHPTSLPGRFGIGDLGPAARQFVTFLTHARQRIWQVLPLGPTGYGDSPYQCFSAFAGNPLLISLHALVDAGLLSADVDDARVGSGRDRRLRPRHRAPTAAVDAGAGTLRDSRVTILPPCLRRVLPRADGLAGRVRAVHGGQGGARHVCHKDILFNVPRRVAIDDRVFLGMQATAVPRFVAVASVGQTRRIAVVTDRQDFAKIGAGDHGADLKALASGALSQAKRQAEINTFKRWPHRNSEFFCSDVLPISSAGRKHQRDAFFKR